VEQFPCSSEKYSLFLINREFVCKILKLIRDLISKIVKTGQKIKNSLLFSLLFPCYFPVLREFDNKE